MTTIILHDEVAALEAERKESTTASTDNISQYLFDALITSDAEEFGILKTEVEEYRRTHPHSWFAATKHPFLGKLLDAIEEAIKFRAETKTEDNAGIKEHNP